MDAARDGGGTTRLSAPVRRFLIRRAVLGVLGIGALVAGFVFGVVPAIVFGAVLAGVEIPLAALVLRSRRPSPFSGTAEEQLAEIADRVAVNASGWECVVSRRDGYGRSGMPVADFSRRGARGPTLWFEGPTTFFVSLVLPNGDEVSEEMWRNSAQDQQRLIEVLAALCRGDFTDDHDGVRVQAAGRSIRLNVFPAIVLKRARDGFTDVDDD